MIQILRSLDNRELAILFWFSIFMAWCLSKPNIREGIKPLIKVLLSRPIFTTILLLVIHTYLATRLFMRMGIWTISEFKISFIWLILAAIPSMPKILKFSDNPTLIKQQLKNTFKMTLIITFYINFFKLPLLGELILIPLTALLGGMVAVAEYDEKLSPVKHFLERLLLLIGIAATIYSIYNTIHNFNQIAKLSTLREFILPIAYNITFIPLQLLLAIYSAYDSLFCRLSFIIRDKQLHSFAKRNLIARFGLNMTSLNHWGRLAFTEDLTTRGSIINSIKLAKLSSSQLTNQPDSTV